MCGATRQATEVAHPARCSFGCDSAAVTRGLRRSKAIGFVERRRTEEDRRCLLVVLTDLGRERFDEVLPSLQALADDLANMELAGPLCRHDNSRVTDRPSTWSGTTAQGLHSCHRAASALTNDQPSAMSCPCTVSAQMTNTDTAMNRIAQIGYQGSHAKAISAIRTAMITPIVRAHIAPVNR